MFLHCVPDKRSYVNLQGKNVKSQWKNVNLH